MVKKFKLFQQCILTPLQADKQYLKICNDLSKIRLDWFKIILMHYIIDYAEMCLIEE